MAAKSNRSKLVTVIALVSLALSLVSCAIVAHALFVDPKRVDISNLELALSSAMKELVGWGLWGSAILFLIATSVIAWRRKSGWVWFYLALFACLGTPLSSAAYFIKERRPSPKRLAAAAREGDLKLAQRMINANVDVNEPPEQRLGFNTGVSRGDPPLATAIIYRQSEIAKLLIARGARVNRMNRSDPIPLNLAIHCRLPEIVQLLLDAGAKTVDGDWNAVESSINSAADRTRDPTVAIQILELLVNHGASVEADELHWLALEKVYHLDYIRKLATLRQTAIPDSANQLTSVLNAVVFGDEATAITLMEKIELTKRNRERLMSGAAKFDNRRIVVYLIKSGTRLDWPELTKQSMAAPLHNAVTYGYIELATLLIEQGADVDAEYGSNNTPLNCAVESNNLQACELLIDHGADVNAPADGVVPIIRAANVGNLDIVKYLIEQGADPNAKAQGHTPLNDAMVRGHTDVIEYLRSLQD